jgi:hypothetical protein
MRSTRSSVDRQTLEIREVTTIAPMKKAAILTPSGLSMTLAMVVYINTALQAFWGKM